MQDAVRARSQGTGSKEKGSGVRAMNP